MKEQLDVLQHKVIDMAKKIEDQFDIVDKLQSTINAYSNLHACCIMQIKPTEFFMQKIG